MTLEEQATHWTLTLRPREPRLAKHLERIDVFGSGDRPACVEALEPDGDGALTLLADSRAGRAGTRQPSRAPNSNASAARPALPAVQP